jgi:hypothetical protein
VIINGAPPPPPPVPTEFPEPPPPPPETKTISANPAEAIVIDPDAVNVYTSYTCPATPTLPSPVYDIVLPV